MMKSRQERVGLFFVRAGQRPDRETQTEPCEHSELAGSHLVSIANSVSVLHDVGPLSLTLQDRLANLPDSAKWAFSELKLTDDGSTIAQAIKDGLAIGVDDGSLKLLFGTAAFVIEGPTPTHRIIGANQVSGPIR